MDSTTPPEITDSILEFCRERLKGTPEYVPIRIESYARHKYCYMNVEKKINRDGGYCLNGWCVWDGSNLVEGEWHTVWVSLDGELVDITPKPDRETRILFVRSDQPWDGRTIIPNRSVAKTATGKTLLRAKQRQLAFMPEVAHLTPAERAARRKAKRRE